MEWKYLFYTLEKFGFGDNFISWVRLLYSAPQASVRASNTRSDYFPSTRQGCPLSPLLFAIAIEPLAIALRVDSTIKGIKRMGTEQKVSLYADDISDLARSIPAALNILKSFGIISGYKLNLSKSEIFPLNSAARDYNFPFMIVHHILVLILESASSRINSKIFLNLTLLICYSRWRKILSAGLCFPYPWLEELI